MSLSSPLQGWPLLFLWFFSTKRQIIGKPGKGESSTYFGEETFVHCGPIQSLSCFVHPCVCVSVPLFVVAVFKCPITPIYKGWKYNRLLAKRFHREKFRNYIGLRLKKISSKMVKNLCADFFWSFPLICMDTQQKLHGSTTKFSWTHNGICMDAQPN